MSGTGPDNSTGEAFVPLQQQPAWNSAKINGRPVQLWKSSDRKAQKNGACQAVYWVKERKRLPESLLSRHVAAKDESKSSGRNWQTGTVYKGEWKDNKKHGFGVQVWSNGNKYEGEWAEGFREGHGVFWRKARQPQHTDASSGTATSTSRSGSSLHMRPPGSSTARSADGSVLGSARSRASQISSASRTSSKKADSKADTPLEKVYSGNWCRDLKEGLGVYYYHDGVQLRYEGMWKADLRHGKGTLYYVNGDVYVGDWHQGMQCGYGTLTKVNGDTYEGEWLNGKKEGSGVFYFRSKQKVYDGEFVNDVPKCGVYCDAKDFFDEGELPPEVSPPATATPLSPSNPLTSRRRRATLPAPPLPELGLHDPDTLLAHRIEAIQNARRAPRNLPFVELSQLFDGEALSSLRRVFNAHDKQGLGFLSLSGLEAALLDLQFSSDVTQLRAVCDQLRLTAPHTTRANFQQFVQAAYLFDDLQTQSQLQQEHEAQEAEYALLTQGPVSDRAWPWMTSSGSNHSLDDHPYDTAVSTSTATSTSTASLASDMERQLHVGDAETEAKEEEWVADMGLTPAGDEASGMYDDEEVEEEGEEATEEGEIVEESEEHSI